MVNKFSTDHTYLVSSSNNFQIIITQAGTIIFEKIYRPTKKAFASGPITNEEFLHKNPNLG